MNNYPKKITHIFSLHGVKSYFTFVVDRNKDTIYYTLECGGDDVMPLIATSCENGNDWIETFTTAIEAIKQAQKEKQDEENRQKWENRMP